jgi:integral membrane protein
MSTRTIESLKSISKKIRYVAVAEGISYLVLLTLSILKRTTSIDVHAGIRYLGMLHGILFVLFLIAIGVGVFILKWSSLRALWAFLASLLPFGTFILDAQLIKEEQKMV